MSWLEALAREGGNEEWQDRLVARAEEVLSVCRLGISDYLTLSVQERAALVCAAMRLQAARAAQAGRAARSELGEAEVLAELDGGETLERLIADRAFERAQKVANARAT